MEILLGAALVALIVWVASRNAHRKPESFQTRRGASAAPSQAETLAPIESQFRAEIERSVQRDFGRSTAATELRHVEPTPPVDHLPQGPAGTAQEAWSPRTQQLEVAGEWYRAENLRTLFSRHAKLSESGSEIRLPATLVPDPANPYDNKAVAVFVDDLHVGYMERPDAKKYHGRIAALPGGELVVTSRQWLRVTGDETWARVTLSIPLPEHLECPNPNDSDCVHLPPGSTVQVTREVEHLDHLVQLLDRYGSETVVAASLRSMIEQRPRSTVELVAVDIDGNQVGVLTSTQTANFLPLVRRAEAEGRMVICRASLRGNTLKADVALHARKVHELDEDELEHVFGS